VYAPAGELCGTVEQEWTFLRPKFEVKDASGSTVLKIHGAFCTARACGSVGFKVSQLVCLVFIFNSH